MVRRRVRLGLQRDRPRHRQESPPQPHASGLVGFGNAYLLTGDDRYLDVWRQQIDAVNAQKKVIDGKTQYPRMYGDQGWYDFTPEKYEHGAFELYYWSMRPEDRRAVVWPWLARLPRESGPGLSGAGAAGRFRHHPRGKSRACVEDTTTPDTRLADDPMAFNPATVTTLDRVNPRRHLPGAPQRPITLSRALLRPGSPESRTSR